MMKSEPDDSSGGGTIIFTLAQLDLSTIPSMRIDAWKHFIEQRYLKSTNPKHLEDFAKGEMRWRVFDCNLDIFPVFFPHAPKSIKRLADRIRTACPYSRVRVETFGSAAPILYVEIAGISNCIAIWHQGIVRAIANGAVLPRHQRLLRRFAFTV